MSKTMFCLFLLVLGFDGIAAQEVENDSTTTRPFFSSGSVIHGTYLEHYFSEDADRHISVTQLNTEMAYYLTGFLSIMTNACVLITRGHRLEDFEDLGSERFGAGFAGFGRIDVFDFRFHSLFAELGYGMVFTNKNFPPRGTKWNFTRRYGFGMSININPDARLILGWRKMHISNGKGFGHPRNPAFDGSGLLAGIRFRF